MARYIDADKAINELADMHCKSDEDGYVWIIRSDAWWRIDSIPSADVRENVHGEWIAVDHDKWTTGTHGLICSKCGGGYHLNIETTIDNWDYCPNCGADMRERGTDGK